MVIRMDVEGAEYNLLRELVRGRGRARVRVRVRFGFGLGLELEHSALAPGARCGAAHAPALVRAASLPARTRAAAV